MDSRNTSSSRFIHLRRPRINRSHSAHQNEEGAVSLTPAKPRTHVLRSDPFVSAPSTSRRLNTSTEDLSDPGQRITVTKIGLNTTVTPPAVECDPRYVLQSNRNNSTDPVRRDKGKERERVERVENIKTLQHHRDPIHAKKHTHDEGEDVAGGSKDGRGFTGPLAVAEFERLKKENDNLKKLTKKHTKKIEELKAQISAGKTSKREHDDQVERLTSKVQSNEEFISNVESAIQCQICMDTYYKPFVLAPCGHVYCLPCLQDWFKKAPTSEDDMDIDPEELNDPEYIMSRQKTCPTCRAIVTRRPSPLFVVNNIVAAFKKFKDLPVAVPSITPSAPGTSALTSILSRRSNSPLVGDEDPWDGIFYEDVETEEEEEDEIDMDSEYMYGYMFGAADGWESYDGEEYSVYGDDNSDEDEDDEDEESGSDDDDHEYVYPHWEPPSFARGRNRFPHDSPHLSLLRRGCTQWMINRFHMEYTHDQGLIAYLHSFDERDLDHPVPDSISTNRMSRLFFGWNIQRYDRELGRRMTGKEYMRCVLCLFADAPERFIMHAGRESDTLDVHMLVKAGDDPECDTTDSEVWA
ncbi:hypothetical protein K435DRAFT_967484 [Dendrothele bispora CBS 962.96]|uniref:RING-type domain-containing protein n=1 Tax=Dendrothele bispora (strain CBS 962.96) TaxID=1314807 RepID=A0A4S8LVB2_DENBC|nr:hypothetical protein K435DRAFT_967484 [Dendrothele bispora CBS 962.96]